MFGGLYLLFCLPRCSQVEVLKSSCQGSRKSISQQRTSISATAPLQLDAGAKASTAKGTTPAKSGKDKAHVAAPVPLPKKESIGESQKSRTALAAAGFLALGQNLAVYSRLSEVMIRVLLLDAKSEDDDGVSSVSQEAIEMTTRSTVEALRLPIPWTQLSKIARSASQLLGVITSQSENGRILVRNIGAMDPLLNVITSAGKNCAFEHPCQWLLTVC